MFIIHLGISGFPKGNAAIQRIRLTFKALGFAGCNTLIINKHSVNQSENLKKFNRVEGIPYISTSLIKNRPSNFILRNLNKISGYLGELFLLIKKRKHIHSAIFYESSVLELLYYRIISKVLGFRLIIQSVEFRSSISSPKKKLTYYNDRLFDHYCYSLCDGIIVISEFLRNRAISKRKSLPILKIPAICDFDEFKTDTQIIRENYLMYCGGIAYLPVIEFITDLFCTLKQLNLYEGKLFLAIGVGPKDEKSYANLVRKINTSGYSDHMVLKTNVPRNELIELYLASELLIVPMRNIFQDIAGFHHKIGEYTAAAKPIISTNLGELKYYFKDSVSAVLADEYSIDSYLSKLKTILPQKGLLDNIGVEGHKVGITKLNYKSYSVDLKNFILSI
jgi:glycosyltransferase involved in cell wall biosynthesis